MFLKKKLKSFSEWWNTANTKKDRIRAAAIGAFGGFWIGLLGISVLGELPMPASMLGIWAFGGAALFSLLGIAFPKIISCICFPFAFFQIGS